MGRQSNNKKRRQQGNGYYSQKENQGVQPCFNNNITIKSSSNNNNNNNNNRATKEEIQYYDLNVPYPRYQSQLQSILKRLACAGYSTIALTHTVYGRARYDQDSSHVTMPLTFEKKSITSDAKQELPLHDKNKKKILKSEDEKSQRTQTSVNTFGLKVLKRLNIVLEDISDLSHYTQSTSHDDDTNRNIIQSNNENNNKKQPTLHELVKSYDLISFTPRTEAIFSALSTSTTSSIIPFDILTIDYSRSSSGGGSGSSSSKLPYVLRNKDMQQYTKHGIVFELNYAPSMAIPDHGNNNSKRKLWIMAGRELKQWYQLINIVTQSDTKNCDYFNNSMARNGNTHVGRPKIILSSGMRTVVGGGSIIASASASTSNDGSGSHYYKRDLGVMALRSPNDLINLCQVVLGWETKMAVEDVMRKNPAYVVHKRAWEKNTGREMITNWNKTNKSIVEIQQQSLARLNPTTMMEQNGEDNEGVSTKKTKVNNFMTKMKVKNIMDHMHLSIPKESKEDADNENEEEAQEDGFLHF